MYLHCLVFPRFFSGNMVNCNFVVFLTFCLVFCYMLSGSMSGPCSFNVRVKQILRNDGFHRNMTYGIVFNADDERERWLYKGCVIALLQLLPRGVYANPDELDDLGRLKRVNAIVKNKINIEMPAEDAQPSNVYVIGKVMASKVYLWLPVHARYHRAKAGGGTASVSIEPPTLFLRCPDQRLAVCEKNLTLSTFLCNGSSKEQCSWQQIPYTYMSDAPTWNVPVGNRDHYYIVSIGTAAVILVGSLYLIFTIHEYKLSGNRKKNV